MKRPRNAHLLQLLHRCTDRLEEFRGTLRERPFPAGVRIESAVETDRAKRGSVANEVAPHCDLWNARNRDDKRREASQAASPTRKPRKSGCSLRATGKCALLATETAVIGTSVARRRL